MGETTVLIENTEDGWSLEILKQFATFQGVLRVDGIGVKQNGNFKSAAIHFGHPGIAEAFAKAFKDQMRKAKP